jgi:predicted nucleic acid-binding protein
VDKQPGGAAHPRGWRSSGLHQHHRSGQITVPGQGQSIGDNNLLIAAQAVALGYTIVTDNEREFARIDGLARENLAALSLI